MEPILSIFGDQQIALTNDFDRINFIEHGANKSMISKFSELSHQSQKSVAELVGASPKTIQRLKENDTLNTEITERFLDVVEIYNEASEQFATIDAVNRWLDRPNGSLYGKTPRSLLNTSIGRNRIKTILIRAKYGVYS